ncbi:hypothetical protein B9G98_04510 [Wickerhamiella sorbophila]|uniref:Uncharacterized protein n=1 Tax=Wickerhamiella sorbophila TaxID=45607 RepID=A0A2T0FPH3_9ASCO|nr:hypothetical protein B9G98_04510 [Wickerhamiella sorbophila]PRT56890.1 hypothetical protein B9G98_04510 [Wickerhamiella sorbophila]
MSVFRVIGSPAAAVKASLSAGQTIKVAYAAVAVSKSLLTIDRGHYASLAGPAELVLSPQFSPSVFELSQKWTVNPRNLVAWNATFNNNVMEGPGEMVLSGRGGICQIDVGVGETLVVEADKLVAHTASAGRTIFRESRFDVASAWTSWMWAGVKDAVQWIGKKSGETVKGVSWLVSKLGAPKFDAPQLKAAQEASEASEPKEPKEPKRSFEMPQNVLTVLAKARHYNAVISDKAFHWTHSPKYVFNGPCSVLIAASKH